MAFNACRVKADGACQHTLHTNLSVSAAAAAAEYSNGAIGSSPRMQITAQPRDRCDATSIVVIGFRAGATASNLPTRRDAAPTPRYSPGQQLR